MKQRAYLGVLMGMMVAGAVDAAPDLSGVWQVTTAIRELKTADNQAPPLRVDQAKIYAENKAKFNAGDLSFDPTAKCISPGLPRVLYLPYPFEIIQRPKKITYLFQWNYWNRQVYMTDKAKEVPYALTLGLSHAKWDGDTLVITTTDLRADNTLLDASGLPHSEALKVTERLQLKDSGKILEDRITIDDSQAFTRTWDTVVRFKKLPAGTEIKQDICLDRTDAGKPAVDWSRPL